MPITGSGTISLTSGTWNLTGTTAGAISGTINVGSGATLNYAQTGSTLSGGQITGTGTFNFETSATVTDASLETAPAPAVRERGPGGGQPAARAHRDRLRGRAELGVHYYAMQFVEGRSLAELIAALRSPGVSVAPVACPGADTVAEPAARVMRNGGVPWSDRGSIAPE